LSSSQKIKKTLTNFKYNEQTILNEVYAHIVETYDEHYSKEKYQATEFIIDAGHGIGFCLGNILKYTQRYGKKGDKKQQEKDLLKLIHYAIIALHIHKGGHNDR
tara:strand:- start:425 stop:736 length:312 start_codon:yes stop_codon:yes gene_type:complete